jgi:nitrogen fixation protein NifQ
MDAQVQISQEQLMAYAVRPEDVLTQAFAGAVRTAFSQNVFPALLFGLSKTQFACLLDRYFPGAWRDLFMPVALLDEQSPCPAFREDEIKDLVALLLEHRANDRDEVNWLAYAIATGCMGSNHLWQDMGLTGRQALSDILRNNFTTLHDKNVGNMKWKKFFYKQLCERAEVNLCKAPSCQVCDDYQKCFGPEDSTGLGMLSVTSGRSPQDAELVG